jgi:hypothetical protein
MKRNRNAVKDLEHQLVGFTLKKTGNLRYGRFGEDWAKEEEDKEDDDDDDEDDGADEEKDDKEDPVVKCVSCRGEELFTGAPSSAIALLCIISLRTGS